MKHYTLEIYESPALHLYGLGMDTSMVSAGLDCPVLWDRFRPFLAQSSGPYSYGVVVNPNTRTGVFAYYAAMPASEETGRLCGLQPVKIPAGLYAFCRVEKLADLGSCYNYAIYYWLQQNGVYKFTKTFLSFERYDDSYQAKGAFTLHFAVEKRESRPLRGA